jgi:hypothetical protein
MLKNRFFKHVFGLLLIAGLASAAFISCDLQDKINDDYKVIPLENNKSEQYPNYVLADKTREIGDKWEEHITEVTDNTISFSSSANIELPKVGEILIKTEVSEKFPYGFLGKVTEIKKQGGQTEIVTEFATLHEAFNELHIDLRGIDISDCLTNPEDLPGTAIKDWEFEEPSNSPMLRSIPDINLPNHPLAMFQYSIPDAWSNGVPFKLSGDFSMKVDMDLYYDIKILKKDDFTLVLKPSFTTNLDLVYKSNTSLSPEFKLTKKPLEFDLSKLPGVNLPLKILLDIYIVVKAGGSIEFETHYSYNAKAEVGAKCEEGKWTDINTVESSKSLTSKLTMDGHIGVGPKLDVKVAIFDEKIAYVGASGTALLDLKAKFAWNLVKAASGELWNSFDGSGAELSVILSADFNAGSGMFKNPYTKPLGEHPISLAKGSLLPAISNMQSGNSNVYYSLSGEVVFPGKYGVKIYDYDENEVSTLYCNDKAQYISGLQTKVPKFTPTLDTKKHTYTAHPIFNLFGLEIVNKDLFVKITDTTLDENGLTGSINEIVPPHIYEKLIELGIEINGGNTPPNIEGTYLATPLEMVKDMAASNQPKQWDMYVTFSNQNNSALTVSADYTMQCEGPWWTTTTMSASGPGSFIVGQGNKFTVFVDGRRTTSDVSYTAKTVEIFSGEISPEGSPEGIKNYHWAVIMVDDSGDPQNVWIENEECYMKKDSDGFSERVNSNSPAPNRAPAPKKLLNKRNVNM